MAGDGQPGGAKQGTGTAFPSAGREIGRPGRFGRSARRFLENSPGIRQMPEGVSAWARQDSRSGRSGAAEGRLVGRQAGRGRF